MTPKVLATKTSEADRWTALPERGTPALLRVIAWIAVHAGRWTARLILYPITSYFVITAHASRQTSYEYLKRVRGHSARWWHVFRHFHCFAATILDRLYLLRGEFERFGVTLHRKEILHREIESGKGSILLGSHLGSFEVLRALGVMQRSFPLKVLMDTAHNQNVTRFFDALNPKIANTVIALDRPDTLLRVKESLDAGFFIGMLGDRVASGDRTTQCQFLGALAAFPAGPILLAAMMRCPVILFFGLYRGGNRYEIHFEHFADEIILARDRRAEDIQLWMQRYVQRLEHYARLAPYNWFNFYPFWELTATCVKGLKTAGETSINKTEIRTLIPHSGLMCVLDTVTEWDDRSIVCISNTHRDPANPLRRGGRLSALHAFEYGAQAAAVHGGLRARSAGATAPPGYLAALRDARLYAMRLDDIGSPLQISARRLFGDTTNTVYECRVSAGGVLLADGRITIMLRA